MRGNRCLTSVILGVVLLGSIPRFATCQAQFGLIDLRHEQTRESALTALRQAYRVDSSTSSPSTDSWTIMSKSGPPLQFYGAVTFSDGRLAFISRIWTPTDETNAFSVIQATIGALTNLARTSTNPCIVIHNYQQQPDFQRQSIEVQCGPHYVSISATRFRGTNGVDITEAWLLP